jgi:hypothetical protein
MTQMTIHMHWAFTHWQSRSLVKPFSSRNASTIIMMILIAKIFPRRYSDENMHMSSSLKMRWNIFLLNARTLWLAHTSHFLQVNPRVAEYQGRDIMSPCLQVSVVISYSSPPSFSSVQPLPCTQLAV